MPKRRTLPKNACTRRKFNKVLSEYKHGTLRSGSGAKVVSRAQAMAIAASEARKYCKKK